MPSKVGPYGKATLGSSKTPISGPSRPSYVSASSSSGKGSGPYSRSTLGTPGGQKPGAHVAPSSSSGPGAGPYAKSTLGSFSKPRFKSMVGDGTD